MLNEALSHLKASDVIAQLCTKILVPHGCSINLKCPFPCTNDPRDCIYEQVQHCIMHTCHPHGSDQFQNGSFKKGL